MRETKRSGKPVAGERSLWMCVVCGEPTDNPDRVCDDCDTRDAGDVVTRDIAFPK